MKCNILIGGDVCPQGKSIEVFQQGNSELVFRDLLPYIERADCSIINLESPLVSKPTPIEKTGPVLGVPEQCISALKCIDVLNLANNHIMDHGQNGLENTIAMCKRFGIGYVGAGMDIQNARRILVKQIQNLRIGIMGAAEHEFSIASQNAGGANPLDAIDFVRCIRKEKGTFDYLLVLLHGGVENFPYPSPRIQKICRFLIEEGADVVVCQHSHCGGCYEYYQRGYIVYGQGNLIFDPKPIFGNCRPPAEWNRGFLINLVIDKQKKTDIQLIAHEQVDGIAGVQKMSENDELSYLSLIDKRSIDIQALSSVDKYWEALCANERYDYISSLLLSNSRWVRFLNRKLHLTDRRIFQKRLRLIRNLIQCESHREVLETVLK